MGLRRFATSILCSRLKVYRVSLMYKNPYSIPHLIDAAELRSCRVRIGDVALALNVFLAGRRVLEAIARRINESTEEREAKRTFEIVDSSKQAKEGPSAV